MDVHPPRARPAIKRLRRLSKGRPVLRWPATLHFHRAAPAWRNPPGMRRFDWGVFWRLAAPGWAHFHTGQARRGRLFLWIYLALLLGGMLSIGTFLQPLLLGLAFSVHASAVIDIILPRLGPANRGPRIVFAAVCSLILFLALYLPAGWLVTRVGSPLRIQQDSPPFSAGDAVLVNRWAFLASAPSRGQVVLYGLPEWRTETGDPGGHGRRIYAFYGERIDRIIALPNDRVRIDGARLFINDQPSDILPLNPANMPRQFSMTIPPDHYFILPSGSPPPIADEGWRIMASVPRDQIHGVAYLRTPVWRLLIIR